MEVNRENLKRCFEETWGQWEFYWKKKKENGGNDVVITPKNFDYDEGDMIYIQLQAGFPHEMCFGHWCYIVKKEKNKLFVIPSIHSENNENNKYEYDIVTEDYLEGVLLSRLSMTDARWVDVQRIDSRKGTRKVHTPKQYILGKFKESVGL